MGLMPKPSLLLLRKPRNKSAALAETNGTLASTMPESGIQSDELVTSSKKLEGMVAPDSGAANMHLAPKNLFNRLPMKYVSDLKKSQEGTKTILAHSLFDKFKRQNKDLVGEYRTEQWVPLPTRGIPRGTSFTDLCRAGKLSVNFSRNYAACIPKQSRKSQRSTQLMVGYYGKQASSCVRDERVVPGLLCIGVEDATYSETDFVGDGETSTPLLPENTTELEMLLEPHTSPTEMTKQIKDAYKIDKEQGLTIFSKLELPWPKLSSSSNIISSSDRPLVQSTDDLSVIINKSEQNSPVSVLEQIFDDASPVPGDATTKSVKLPIRPHRINFEERSPVKRVKFHSDNISQIDIPSKKHTSSALEYARKVLDASGLTWYQLALKWHYSTQMLDSATYTKLESQSTSLKIIPLETRLLFDHINEILHDIYQPYNGFYPWVPLSRPNTPHLTERDFFNEIIKIAEKNLSLIQHQFPEQKLVMISMEKCGTWIDIRKDIEDMVLEIVEEVAEELIEEFVFEMWID